MPRNYTSTETIQCMQQFVDGTWSYPRAGIIRQISVSKDDSVKRVKPASLSLANGTSWTCSKWQIHSAAVVRRVRLQLNPVPVYGTQITVVGDHVPLGTWSDPLEYETAFEQIVLNKLRVKARGMVVNLGNVIAEYQKTAKTFADLLARMVVLTLAVKRRDPRILYYGYLNKHGKLRKGATGFGWTVEVQRDIAQQWLQYVYGIKPLMQDASEIMKHFKNANKDPLAPVIKVSASKSSKSLPMVTTPNSYFDSSVKCQRIEHSSKVVSGKAEIIVKNDILKSTVGAFGLTNPLSVAWEVTPFSFVVDWWANIGEFIESLDNALYFDPSSLCQITTHYSQYTAGEVLGVGGLYERHLYSRGLPKGLGTTVRVRFKPDPSILHIANGVALLRTLARR